MKIFKNTLILTIFLTTSSAVMANCMSHSTEIPYRKDVCFSSSMKQYMCVKRNGEYGLEFVQKLSMKSSLESCYHVDKLNLSPAAQNLISQNISEDQKQILALIEPLKM